jgi:hypothetical protein
VVVWGGGGGGGGGVASDGLSPEKKTLSVCV